MITVVTGLPRSGTSLMMHMLAAGGMGAYYDRDDDFNSILMETKKASSLPDDWEWLRECEGKCIKILLPCRRKPPRCFEYRFIWMARAVDGQVKSLMKFMSLVKRKASPFSEEELRRKSVEFACESLNVIQSYDNSGLMIVGFAELLKHPRKVAKRVMDFVRIDLDVDKMAKVAVQREPGCFSNMMEVELYGGNPAAFGVNT